jgi:hypothetical protein
LGEIAEANRLGIPVFKGLDEVTVWNGTRFRDQAPAPEAPEPTRPSAAGMAIINAARKVAILVTPSLLVFPKDFWTENGFIFLDEQVAGDCVYCIHFMLCMECKNACTSFPEWEFVQKLADLLGYMHIAVSWHEDRLWIEASGSHA